MKNMLLAVLVIGLSGCSASKSQITDMRTGAWAEFGRYDVSKGLPKKNKETLLKLDEKYGGKRIDYQAYSDAWDAGLEEYCQLDNAYILGLKEQDYLGICDHLPQGEEFRANWERTRMLNKDD